MVEYLRMMFFDKINDLVETKNYTFIRGWKSDTALSGLNNLLPVHAAPYAN